MNCAEFQKVLPYIIESGGNPEEEAHLQECPICADLVQDLRYIAEQAKLLLPMRDPSPQVWDGIQENLQREGLVKPARARGRLLGFPSWSSLSMFLLLLRCHRSWIWTASLVARSWLSAISYRPSAVSCCDSYWLSAIGCRRSAPCTFFPRAPYSHLSFLPNPERSRTEARYRCAPSRETLRLIYLGKLRVPHPRPSFGRGWD